MDGRVLQVNVSPGGVPKTPVDQAWVGPLGLDGDRHRHDTVHGGPHRAVALLAIEAIERIQADGHPIEPGSVGENLTTSGIELATLPVGTRLAIGDTIVLELSSPANPCDVIKGSFRNGKSGRISILTHPTDSRMYARTLAEGTVRPGDPIRILPPAPESDAARLRILERIDAATLDFNVAIWRAVQDAGFAIRFTEDGELAMASSGELGSTAFNRALGHRMLPNLTDRMVEFFRLEARTGWVVADREPWPGAVAEQRTVILTADPADVAPVGAAPLPPGTTVREIGRNEADRWASVLVEASGLHGRDADAWHAIAGRIAGTGGHHLFVVEQAGQPLGVGSVFTRRRVGLLGTAAILPSARGRGLHRALIAHRAARAIDRGCTLIAASAERGSASAANLLATGFEGIDDSALYRFEPDRPVRA
jgi:MOSC domain-containing protein YiiM/GNAT superfamily N-acetyltransferase